MKKYKVKITPYAKGQLQEIRDYLKHQLMNPDAAKNFLLEIQKRTRELEYLAESNWVSS